jgi:hypothetical protein
MGDSPPDSVAMRGGAHSTYAGELSCKDSGLVAVLRSEETQ